MNLTPFGAMPNLFKIPSIAMKKPGMFSVHDTETDLSAISSIKGLTLMIRKISLKTRLSRQW